MSTHLLKNIVLRQNHGNLVQLNTLDSGCQQVKMSRTTQNRSFIRNVSISIKGRLKHVLDSRLIIFNMSKYYTSVCWHTRCAAKASPNLPSFVAKKGGTHLPVELRPNHSFSRCFVFVCLHCCSNRLFFSLTIMFTSLSLSYW